MKVNNFVLMVVKLSASFICAILIVPFSIAAHAGDLIVVVENIKSEQGNVRAAVFNNATTFTKTPLLGQFVSAKIGTVSIIFKDLPAGQYAVSAFQDLNGNDKLDRNFVGKPVEPYGFSRDARGTFGPPSFEEAMIQIDDAVKTVAFSVK